MVRVGQGGRWRERAPGLTKRWLSTTHVAAAVERGSEAAAVGGRRGTEKERRYEIDEWARPSKC